MLSPQGPRLNVASVRRAQLLEQLALISFRLNDEVANRIDVEEGEPLLYVLRRLGDPSVRYGCGAEQCGTCRVLVDGEPEFACTLAASEVEGRCVETAAGIDTPVRKALIDFNAGQCGYCLPGIVVAAEALFRNDAAPTEAAIRAALEPHLCRCGAHPRILRAIVGVAEGSNP